MAVGKESEGLGVVGGLACGAGMGFLGGLAMLALSPNWTPTDLIIGPAVGFGVALVVLVLRDFRIAQIAILAFLGGLAGRLPMQNAEENMLKLNLMVLESEVRDKVKEFRETPPERQRAAVGDVIESYGKLMTEAAKLRDRRLARNIGERMGASMDFLAREADRDPEMALKGLGKIRAAAAASRNAGIWLGATKALEEASVKIGDTGIRARARIILEATASPADAELRKAAAEQ